MSFIYGVLQKFYVNYRHMIFAGRRSRQKSGEDGFQCSQCDKSYHYLRALTRHVKNIHGQHAHAVTCDICQRVFKNVETFRSHMHQKHTGPKSTTFLECSICNERFKKSSYLELHMRGFHNM